MRKQKIFAIAVAALFVLTFSPFNVFAKGGGFSGGGGRSFGGGSSFGGGRSFGGSHSSSPSRSYSTPSHSSPSSPSRSYSTPSVPSTPSPSRQFSTPNLKSPSIPAREQSLPTPRSPELGKGKSGIDSGAQKAQKMAESKKSYDAAHPKEISRPSYSNLKKELNYQKMENRQLRQQQAFGSYYGRPVPQYYYGYHDSFGNVWFWLWLMDRPMHQRDTWVYNHRDQIDPARYEEMKKKDADLENRLKALEAQGVKKDPSYVPQGIDRDLMYSDEAVKKAYEEKTKSGFPWGWVLGIALLIGLVYLIFFVRWNIKKKRGF